jgi:CHAD domain-containing protein
LKAEGSRARAVAHREAFKQWAADAGETRNWDVLYDVLEKSEKRAALSTLSAPLAAQRERVSLESRRRIVQADLKKNLPAWIDEAARDIDDNDGRGGNEETTLDDGDPATPVALEARVTTFIEARMHRSKTQLKHAIGVARRAKHDKLSALHEVRKAGKKVRYLMMSLGPVLGKGSAASHKRLSKMQNRLGALNDVVASIDLLKRHQTLFDAATSSQAKKAVKRMKRTLKAQTRKAERAL